MDANAFERFEKSRSGLLIPVMVFVLGAIATVWAMLAVQSVIRAGAAAQQELRAAGNDTPPEPDMHIDPAANRPQIRDQGPQVP